MGTHMYIYAHTSTRVSENTSINEYIYMFIYEYICMHVNVSVYVTNYNQLIVYYQQCTNGRHI